MSKKGLPILFVLIGASSYGFLSSVIKIAYTSGWNDQQISVSQMFMGMLLMWVVLLFQPKAWSNPLKGPWIRLSIIGIFGLALCTILYNASLSEMDASLSIVLLFQFTWITVLLDCFMNRRLPKRKQLAAVVFIMGGTLLSVNIFESDWSRFSLWGVICGLGAALAYSLFLFLTGRIQTTMHPIMKSAIMLTASMPILFILYPPSNFFANSGTASLAMWGILLGILGQVIPTLTFNFGIPRIGSSLSATLGSIELPVALISAYFLLGESVQGIQWFGMLLIMAGILTAEQEAAS